MGVGSEAVICSLTPEMMPVQLSYYLKYIVMIGHVDIIEDGCLLVKHSHGYKPQRLWNLP